MTEPRTTSATLSLDFWAGVGANNPVLVQMLGLCPTMAVSNSVLGNVPASESFDALTITMTFI